MKTGVLLDKAQMDRAQRREEAAAKQKDADLRWLLSDARGRRFFSSLCFGACRLVGPSFNASGSLSFYQEGQRAVGIQLWEEAQRVAPADVVLMLTESLTAQQEADARQRQEDAQERDE